MKNFKKSLIVSNADIISNINFKEMIKSHIKNKSLMKIIFNNKKVLIIGGSDSMFNN
jgi:NDP-sugar pyrophosphorylase family protein